LPAATSSLPSFAGALPGWARRAPAWIAGLILLAIALAGWSWLSGEREGARAAAAQRFVLSAEGLLSALKDVETGQRGFVMTGNEVFLQPYAAGLAAVPERLAELDAAAADAGLPPSGALRDMARAKLEWTTAVVATRRRDGQQAAIADVAGGRGRELMDALRTEASLRQEAARREAAALEAAARTRSVWFTALPLAAAFAACLLMGALVLARRRMEQRATSLLGGVMAHAPVGLGFLDREMRVSNPNRSLAALGERTLGARQAAIWCCPRRCAPNSPRAWRRC
jgi:CHASE3 domain sensor protein